MMDGAYPSQQAVLLAFLSACVVLAIIPGPSVVYVLTRTLRLGRLAGMASVFGVATGNLCNAIGAAVGLAALFALSPFVFLTVKYAGAAYLFYLAITTLTAPAKTGAMVEPAREAPGRIFCDGFLVAALNPKTTLFFAAFLPQFIVGEGSRVMQCIAYGAAFVIVAAMIDVIYVASASVLGPMIFKHAPGAAVMGRYVTAAAFAALGSYTVVFGAL